MRTDLVANEASTAAGERTAAQELSFPFAVHSAFAPGRAPGAIALWTALGIAAVLSGFYLRMISGFTMLPADILMWGESGFVETIIKLRVGVPIYSAPSDSNSIIYTPLSPVLTYALSSLTGLPPSVPLFRWIQLFYVAVAALVGARCWWLLRELAFTNHQLRHKATWSVFVVLSLFLAGTSEQVNRFVHCLHGDALALLVSMICFWTLLRYARQPDWKRLTIMAVCPAVGFLTKQFLVSWMAVMLSFLVLNTLVQHRWAIRSYNLSRWAGMLKPALLFAGIAGAFLAATIGMCAIVWGRDFFFWVFDVMGPRKHISLSPASYQISIPRAVDHVIRAWSELAIGTIGGLWVLRDRNIARLGPLWLAYLVLLAAETYSSGAGWSVLYHFGPGVVIGCIWFLAALSRWWPSAGIDETDEFPKLTWLAKPILGLVAVACFFAALHLWPSGDANTSRFWRLRMPSADVNRYIADIEKEFQGFAPGEVLLDAGNWVALQRSFVAKDQAAALADQPPSNIYSNINVFASRIRTKAYRKILVHDIDSPYFLYDWQDWPKSSGVRALLYENYIKTRVIPAAGGDTNLPPTIAMSGPVSVFVPRHN